MPPKLPNEIWDQIWLERCKMGFEPRIVQAKWVFDGRFHVPAFYTAQPQPVMTQICQGARQVAAKEFYSRISDNPFTGVGGFWWNEKDVLYIDQDFYRQLRTPRMAIFMGRDYITRVAVDIEIDAGGAAMTKLLFDWFPRLSQLFFLCPARLLQASQFKNSIQTIRASPCDPSIPYSPGRSVRGFDLAGSESASTKSLPITTFGPIGSWGPLEIIPTDLFIRAQGLVGALHSRIPPEEWRALPSRFRVGEYIPAFIFGREDTTLVISGRDSPSIDEGMCFYLLCHVLIVPMLTCIPCHRNTRGSNDCQYLHCSYPFGVMSAHITNSDFL